MFVKEKVKTEFYDYNPAWEIEAEKTITQLKIIFGENVADIQHIGGTAMKKIKSKPVIDIAAGLYDINLIVSFADALKKIGFVCDTVNLKNSSEKKTFIKYGERGKTHIIHVVPYNSNLWFEYIIFRDYININDRKAREYEYLKLSVNGKYKSAMPSYIKAKSDFIKKIIADNFYSMMLGKNITVKLNQETQEKYPKYSDGVYPLISGSAENLKTPGGKNHGAYIIGVYDYDISEKFDGKIIAYIDNGTEKSFIAAKENTVFYKPEICEAVEFYENSLIDGSADIICLYEKSCGAVIYTKDGSDIKFLLVKGRASNRIGFPKGHVEKGETEAETAIREIYEETSLNVVLYSDFKEEYGYMISGYIQKKVVYFLAEFKISEKYKIRDGEILEQWLVPYEKAYQMLTFCQDKTVLKKAYEKIK